jgi:spermidine synthase
MKFTLVLLCFFLSGFAALLYETAWTREFATVFGTSELAVAAVLAAYMAGLASGSAIAARVVARVTRPVLVYGALELGIGLWALAVPWWISALRGVYVAWFGGAPELPDHLGAAALAFQLGSTFAILAPCSALMGATLPLLARHAVHSDDEIARRVGALYAINTAGAIAGTLSAGFVLLPALGLRYTVFAGAALNLVVFGLAVLAARGAAATPASASPPVRAELRWILPAIGFAGAASFASEVLWTRLLSHVLGGSTPSFASMLASFLAGIAIGSALAARVARTREAAARGFALAQLGCAITAWGAFRAANFLPALSAAVGASATNPAPAMLAAIVVLVPLTLCIGACFPFAVRLHAPHADAAAAASGRVYAWNTLGSIVGSVATGFWLLPMLGLAGMAAACIALHLLLALGAAVVAEPRRKGIAAAALVAAVALALASPSAPWGLLRHAVFAGAPAVGLPAFLGVGRTANVTLFDEGWRWRLFSNGLPEAAIRRSGVPPEPARETEWLSILPHLARPDAKRMLIVGLGGARTLAAVPAAFETVDVIELEPKVETANRAAQPRADRDPLDAARVRLRFGDARGALALTSQRWDAIVSQPSHPWTAGASHLYTREFFELARDHLTPSGVFVQWIGASLVDAELLASLIATLRTVFPELEVFAPESSVLIFVASREPIDTLANAPRALAASSEELARGGILRIEDVAAAFALASEDAAALADGAELLTDDHNRLAAGLRLRNESKAAAARVATREPLASRSAGFDLAVLARRLAARGFGPRIERLASALVSNEADRSLLRGWAAIEAGESLEAAQQFERVRSERPGDPAAALGLALVRRGSTDSVALGLEPRGAALVAGWRANTSEDWEALRALDPALAGWHPGELMHPEAARLRAQWRIALPGAEAELAQQALEVLAPLLARSTSKVDLMLWASAAVRSGDPELAWAALDGVAQELRARDLRDWLRVAELARGLPDHPRGAELERQLEALDAQR